MVCSALDVVQQASVELGLAAQSAAIDTTSIVTGSAESLRDNTTSFIGLKIILKWWGFQMYVVLSLTRAICLIYLWSSLAYFFPQTWLNWMLIKNKPFKSSSTW